MSTREIEGAPERDPLGRVVEATLIDDDDGGRDSGTRVRLAVDGLVVEADDLDGEGLARALATLAAMAPEER